MNTCFEVSIDTIWNSFKLLRSRIKFKKPNFKTVRLGIFIRVIFASATLSVGLFIYFVQAAGATGQGQYPLRNGIVPHITITGTPGIDFELQRLQWLKNQRRQNYINRKTMVYQIISDWELNLYNLINHLEKCVFLNHDRELSFLFTEINKLSKYEQIAHTQDMDLLIFLQLNSFAKLQFPELPEVLSGMFRMNKKEAESVVNMEIMPTFSFANLGLHKWVALAKQAARKLLCKYNIIELLKKCQIKKKLLEGWLNKNITWINHEFSRQLIFAKKFAQNKGLMPEMELQELISIEALLRDALEGGTPTDRAARDAIKQIQENCLDRLVIPGQEPRNCYRNSFLQKQKNKRKQNKLSLTIVQKTPMINEDTGFIAHDDGFEAFCNDLNEVERLPSISCDSEPNWQKKKKRGI